MSRSPRAGLMGRMVPGSSGRTMGDGARTTGAMSAVSLLAGDLSTLCFLSGHDGEAHQGTDHSPSFFRM
ncbi:hypothetical protein CRUP_025665, partial [Coryphaenoides rupestris]